MTGEPENETIEMGGHGFEVAISNDPDAAEGESWQAVLEELGGCTGRGATREAALENLRGEIVRYVAADLLDP